MKHGAIVAMPGTWGTERYKLFRKDRNKSEVCGVALFISEVIL